MRSSAVVSLHVLQGSPSPHVRVIRAAASRSGRLRDWTVPKVAAEGDAVVFYIAGDKEFIATGIVAGLSERNAKRGDYWYGRFMAPIRDVRILPKPVSLDDARRIAPEWRYLDFVEGTVTAPPAIAVKLIRKLYGGRPPALPAATVSDVEGTITETKRTTRGRSKKLRLDTLEQARGRCETCQRDFSRLLDGRGVRVLQVHHRKQLASLRSPVVNTVDDLAAVCANCHLLIHLDSKKAMPVKRLRELLARRQK